MGLYNVVGRATMAAGQPEDVTQVLANLDAIAAILNGGIDNSNVNAAAAIVPSKLANVPKTTVSAWSGGPPAGAADTDIWIATAAGSTYHERWVFQYNSAEPTYKWMFIGGPPVAMYGGSGSPSPINTYVNISAGTYAISRAGTYIVSAVGHVLTGAGSAASYTPAIYANTPANVQANTQFSQQASFHYSWAISSQQFTFAAGIVLGLSAAVGQVGATFDGHSLTITPVAII